MVSRMVTFAALVTAVTCSKSGRAIAQSPLSRWTVPPAQRAWPTVHAFCVGAASRIASAAGSAASANRPSSARLMINQSRFSRWPGPRPGSEWALVMATQTPPRRGSARLSRRPRRAARACGALSPTGQAQGGCPLVPGRSRRISKACSRVEALSGNDAQKSRHNECLSERTISALRTRPAAERGDPRVKRLMLIHARIATLVSHSRRKASSVRLMEDRDRAPSEPANQTRGERWQYGERPPVPNENFRDPELRSGGRCRSSPDS